eukprot:2636367-Rhodomonas_salina.3
MNARYCPPVRDSRSRNMMPGLTAVIPNQAWAFANVPELAAKLGYEPPEAAATPAGGEGAAGGEAGAAGGEAAKPMPGGKTKKE